jgi:thioredoxin reductase (NADPH)
VSPDLVIVGAGPAGVAAALWAKSLGLSARVLEAEGTAGGQLHHVHQPLANLPGATGGDGPALARTLAEELAAAGIDVRYGHAAQALEPHVPAVRTADGVRHAAGAVLIVTGVRRRRLEVPGEREYEGRGVSASATQDRARFAGEEMVVAGGGDGAYENALLLADVGCAVTLAVRGTPRARREFRERVAASPRIEVLEGTQVIGVLGGVSGQERVRAVRLEGPRGTFEQPAAGLVVKIGVIPNTEWCAPALELDGEAYLPVDEHFGTSRPRVWAAGDVTGPPLSGIAVAFGQGALAVHAIRSVLRAE